MVESDVNDLDNFEPVARIVVIGVGGAGNNAVNRMTFKTKINKVIKTAEPPKEEPVALTGVQIDNLAMTLVGNKETNYNNGGGVYTNLFCAHPPFQIDGNFGYTAGVSEMLLQSQSGLIHLLPALPQAWSTGSVKGLRARGGFEIDIYWQGGALQKTKIKSLSGNPLKILYKGKSLEYNLKAGEEVTLNGKLEKK